MTLTINGKSMALPDGIVTAGVLLAWLGLQGRRVALEVNGAIVPRSSFVHHRLHEGDNIEIVHAIGGG